MHRAIPVLRQGVILQTLPLIIIGLTDHSFLWGLLLVKGK